MTARSMRVAGVLGALGVTNLITGGVSWLLAARSGLGQAAPTVLPRAVTARGDLAADEQATIELFKRCSPSVVYITNLAVRRDFYGLNVSEIPQGTGSGFLWDEQGHVVTNFHVIQGAQAAEVTLADHSTWPARFVGAEPDKDIAVLKIDAPAAKLAPLAIGHSADVVVGQKTYAIGNPFGLDQTLTTGIVSALNRQIQSVTRRAIDGVIQTDAAINPGNSGGPLLDSAGRLIGVNTAIYSPQGQGSVGIGFAVPVDTVNRIVPQLIQHGRIVRPGLGVGTADEDIARRFGIAGALVLTVSPGSSAERAGIKPTRRDAYGRLFLGDVIVAVDGLPVTSGEQLGQRLETKAVGERVSISLMRGQQRLELEITLQALR